MAAYTLFDIAYRVARELAVVHEGTATGGSVTTTIDNVYLRDRFGDDFFNAGTLFVLYDAGGAAAAPQGEWARITDFAETTGTVTHGTLTAAIASGDRYAVCNAEYTLDNIIMNINSVLSEIQVPTVDNTTLDTDGSTTEYTLPTGVLDRSIKVWSQRSTTTNHNLWVELHDWYIAETATGTAKKLIFRTQPNEPWEIKLEYWLPHTPLYAKADKLNEAVNINRVVIDAALRCLLWKKAQKAQDDPVLDFRITDMMARSAAMKAKYPNRRPGVKLATYGLTDNFNNTDED